MKLLTLLIVSAMAVSCAQNTKKETSTTTATEQTDAKAAAKTKATTSTGSIECKSGTDVRTLEVKANGETHEVVYTKFGEAKSIATGGKEHCEAIKERVKGNLANAGFTCS